MKELSFNMAKPREVLSVWLWIRWDGIGVLRKENIICAEENMEAELKEENGDEFSKPQLILDL